MGWRIGDHKMLMRRGAKAGLIVLGAAGLSLAGGCSKPLFAPTEERSQYDRYDGIRSQRSAPYVEDEFGRQYPNLRGRLMTKQ